MRPWGQKEDSGGQQGQQGKQKKGPVGPVQTYRDHCGEAQGSRSHLKLPGSAGSSRHQMEVIVSQQETDSKIIYSVSFTGNRTNPRVRSKEIPKFDK